jgi:hypothetical protein
MRLSEKGIDELAKSLAAAQGQFSAAERAHIAKVTSKKGEGSSYSYNYADLAAYLDVCREPLASNGLSFVQSVLVADAKATVTTLLLHQSGQWIEFDPLTITASDLMPQSIGSAITYARRYSLSAATGMASEADDDGNTAQGNNAETARRELPDCPKCGHNRSVIVGKAEYGGGMVCFKKKGGCGHNWHPEAQGPPAEEPFGDPTVDDLKKKGKLTTADKLPSPPTLSKDDTGAFDYDGHFLKALEKAGNANGNLNWCREYLFKNRDHFKETINSHYIRWYNAAILAAADDDHDRIEELDRFLEADKVYLKDADRAKIGVQLDKRKAVA